MTTTIEATDEYLLEQFEKHTEYNEVDKFFIRTKDLVAIKRNPNLSEMQRKNITALAQTYLTNKTEKYATSN